MYRLVSPGRMPIRSVISMLEISCENSSKSAALYSGYLPQHPWCISPDVSAARALVIVAALRTLGLFDGESHEQRHLTY